jgi:hypothetical protein
MGTRLLILLVLCLLVGACARGPGQRDQATPSVSPTSTDVSSPTDTPVPAATLAPEVTGTTTPAPSATSTAALAVQPTATPLRALTDTPIPVPTASYTPVSVPTATGTADAAPTGTADAAPTIHFFRASVKEANPGDTIVLEWESEGATDAVLYHIPPSGQLPQSGWQVNPSGAYTYTIEPDESNWSQFLLTVQDDSERGANANLTVKLRCPEPWFFSPAPDECPTTPIVSAAAEGHFERGTMIWIKEPWNDWVDDGGWIVVLYDDDPYRKEWSLHRDEWVEGAADRDPRLTPPPGLFQPVRGFGWLWRENPDIQGRLGWAIDEELGFQTILQNTRRYKYNSTYLRALDGNVWHLGPERSSWEKINVDQ